MGKIITVKTAGKLMLFGEHAVVYGYHAIVSGISKYLTLRMEIISGFKDRFILNGVPDKGYLASSIGFIKNKYKCPFSFKVETTSDIGPFGLGSSSALTVSLIRGFLELTGERYDQRKIFAESLEAYRSFYPEASGFDLASVVWGGTLMFSGKDKSVEIINHDVLPIIAVFSGVKADTRKIVAEVREKRRKNPKRMAAIFSDIETVTLKAKEAIKKKRWQEAGELMDISQNSLRELGVSDIRIEKVISVLKDENCMGAKISGAGGGDCVIAIFENNRRKKAVDNLTLKGYKVLDINIGGVKI